MLKGVYVVLAVVIYTPFLALQGLMGLLLWESKPWDDACEAMLNVIDNTVNGR